MPTSGYRTVNRDGSRNVWCPQCRSFICTSGAMTAINTAICVICQLKSEGVELTEDQERELRGVRMGDHTVSEAAAYLKPVDDPMIALSTTDTQVEAIKTGRVGFFFKALVKNVITAGIETIKEAIPESKQVARANKRKKLFDLPLDEDKK